MSEHPQTPKELDDFVDKVLAYKPKPKSDAGKARKRKAKKVEKEKLKSS
jgi:hypothetical protein